VPYSLVWIKVTNAVLYLLKRLQEWLVLYSSVWMINVTRAKNANYDGFKMIMTTKRTIFFSHVDIQAIGVAGTGPGHKRLK
jgi:hypothetical protein